jgi:hypothetical protein
MKGMALQSKGNMMCLLIPTEQRRRGKSIHEYGVLMHNMEEDSHLGTCVMMDGRLSWDKLGLAFKRVKEDKYVMFNSMRKQCRQIYLAAIADVTAVELQIPKSEREYIEAEDKVRKARRAALEAKAQEKKEPAAPEPRAKKEPATLKKGTLNDICVGTCVAMFFR